MSRQEQPAVRPAEILRCIAGRPWPIPRGPWVQAQTWHDLLFMHYRAPVDALRRLVPRPLDVDTYDGDAWISIVPFWMSGIRLHWSPALPWLSSFPELNVRTYVTHGGGAGVYFFSLDAGNPLAVELARRWYHLPYFNARMSAQWSGDWMRYSSLRVDRRAPPGRFEASYRPVGGEFRADAGSLDDWLTARYCLYAGAARGRVYRADIHHLPWPLQRAELELRANTLLQPLGLARKAPELLHFSPRLDVIAWGPELLTTG